MKLPCANAIERVLPLLILGAAALIMLFQDIPQSNRDLVMQIIAGILGFLSKGAIDAAAGRPLDRNQQVSRP